MIKVLTVGMVKEQLELLAGQIDEVNEGLRTGMSGDTAKILNEIFKQLIIGMEYIEKHDNSQQPIPGDHKYVH